ncbi:AAA family ATPase, partial [Pseudoalteromonas sp. SIMBA_162]|uniref:AAA family ATPase n=1 Tax=Pseudoalteromonas sp. SIMBA_162 TaxID=3080867 RepID=UPI00397BABCD
VIVMTSNLGSEMIQRMSGLNGELAEDEGSTESADERAERKAAFQYDDMKTAVMEVVGDHFRPELINRIDEVVVFHALGQAQIASIAGIQLERLKARLAERDLGFEITDPAMALL